MSRHPDAWPRGARDQLVQEAARLMAEQGIDDPLAARHKAATRLGLAAARDLPGGEEIVAALRDYLALFQAEPHRRRLTGLRQVALRAMRLLAPLAEVRLVGPVLEGTAVAATPVTLHLLGVTAEEVAIHLLESRISYRESARTVNYGPRDKREVPAFALRVDGTTIELLVFSPDAPRQAPLNPVTGRALARAGVEAVTRLLEE